MNGSTSEPRDNSVTFLRPKETQGQLNENLSDLVISRVDVAEKDSLNESDIIIA